LTAYRLRGAFDRISSVAVAVFAVITNRPDKINKAITYFVLMFVGPLPY
jgi:hypothetical protein